jgi:hypothetical protein
VTFPHAGPAEADLPSLAKEVADVKSFTVPDLLRHPPHRQIPKSHVFAVRVAISLDDPPNVRLLVKRADV